jgi:hypothetical protein
MEKDAGMMLLRDIAFGEGKRTFKIKSTFFTFPF